MMMENILRIANLLCVAGKSTAYQIVKITGKQGSIYRCISIMEKLHIIVKEGNIITLSEGNTYKLTENGTFLVFFGNGIPVILNCPYWNYCKIRNTTPVCFGEPNCVLLKQISEDN